MIYIVLLLFIFLLFFANVFIKDFYNPFLIFINFWVIQILTCLIFFSNTTKWSYSGLLFIYFLCWILLLIYAKFCNKKYKDNIEYSNDNSKNNINFKNAYIFLIMCIIIGFFYSALLIKKYGFSFSNLFNIEKLLLMNSSTSYQRYFGGFNLGTIDKILLTFVYVSPMCAGYLFAFNNKFKHKLISFLSFAPELIIFLTENTKAPLIGCIIFFAISWLLGFVINNGNTPKINILKLFKIILVVLLIYCSLFISMMLRNGSLNITTYNIVSKKINNYIFGHVPAFDNWFDGNLRILPTNFGTQTFIGIYNLLGIKNRSQGIYIDSYTGGALGSNVFTYFRGLIDDFGVVWCIVFISIVLLLADRLYRNILRGNKKCFYQVLYVAIMSFILFCFVSIFSYNSFTFAFILFYLFIIIIKKKVKKNG